MDKYKSIKIIKNNSNSKTRNKSSHIENLDTINSYTKDQRPVSALGKNYIIKSSLTPIKNLTKKKNY